jgi:hypothetical protein
MGEVFRDNSGGEYAKYFVQELRTPEHMGDPDFLAMYGRFAKRILWMDGDLVPGAFQMNTSWYCKVPERDPLFEEHVHDYGELIGFYGSDPDDPYNLGAEIEFSMAGEARLLTRSTLIYAPPSVPHNPMRILRVDRPVFHFSVVTNSVYDGEATYK